MLFITFVALGNALFVTYLQVKVALLFPFPVQTACLLLLHLQVPLFELASRQNWNDVLVSVTTKMRTCLK